ncbi:MAG TPA: T9SS type A sorting domain-containing protein [candidate division WOR-3 bacterium]|uniref:T9SS type A sorting domain-containing protein n=1 Tax=candidate division WOR-3 bacterium TaxID=2052148 RepID=A0A7V0T5N5_UNCW3|nr:T9SS type A sorting domain-containing protein [candidate division WOR-3 bacterium]
MDRSFIAALLVLVTALAPASPADSLNCRLAGNWPFGPTMAVACDPARNLVFLGAGGGVYVLNVADPTEPALLSEGIRTAGRVKDMVHTGNRLYSASGGLYIHNTESPGNPVQLGELSSPRDASGLAVAGNRVYVTDTRFGLRVVDVSDPARPEEVGSIQLPGSTLGVALSADANHAFIASDTAGFRVVDVSDPADPVELGYYLAPGSVREVSGRDNLAFLACDDSALVILDISDPASPVVVSRTMIPDTPLGVHADGHLVYVANHRDGFRVFDCTDPAGPELVGHYDTPWQCYDIRVHGSLIYIADWGCGLQVYEGPVGIAEEPESGRLRGLDLYPNPAAGRVAVRLGSAGPGAQALLLYDASGRYRARWTLTGGRGEFDLRALGAGVYYLRTEQHDTAVGARLVIAR